MDTIAKQGAEIEVKLATGQTEKVKVSLLPLGKMPAFFERIEDDIGMIQLCTGKSKDFCEAIDFDSAMEVVDLCHSVNFPRAQRWAERRAERLTAIAPLAKRGIAIQKQLMT